MRFPVDGIRNKNWKVTQGYKPTHPAWDIAPIPANTPNVKLFAPQVVVVASKGFRETLEGHWIHLRTANGLYYYFGHMASASNYKVGTTLNEGTVFGIMGKTGLADGIHTHHEIRLQHGPGPTLDPGDHYKQVLGGDTDMVTQRGLDVIYRFRMGRAPTAKEIENNLGKRTFDEVDKIVVASIDHQNLVVKAKEAKKLLNDFLSSDIR